MSHDIPLNWFLYFAAASFSIGLMGVLLRRNAIAVLSENAAKALASKEVADALANQGVEPSYAGPAELDAFLKADTAMWRALVKEAGITPQ